MLRLPPGSHTVRRVRCSFLWYDIFDAISFFVELTQQVLAWMVTWCFSLIKTLKSSLLQMAFFLLAGALEFVCISQGYTNEFLLVQRLDNETRLALSSLQLPHCISLFDSRQLLFLLLLHVVWAIEAIFHLQSLSWWQRRQLESLHCANVIDESCLFKQLHVLYRLQLVCQICISYLIRLQWQDLVYLIL